MLSHLARPFFTAAGALLLTLLLNLALAQPAALQAAPVAGSELAPSTEPAARATAATTATFSATALLTGSAASLSPGEPLTVTAQLVTTGTCGFALYDVTLRQSDPLFSYADPPNNVIGPPGANPAVWRLTAWRTGVTTFTVDFYGETNCDGVWQWTTVRGMSQPVTITAAVFLPLVNNPFPLPRLTDLGTLTGAEDSDSTAFALNNSGQIVGESSTGNEQPHAVLWHNNVITDLGTLGGSFSSAIAINERGQVIGNSTTAGGEQHAFFWAGGVITDIGALGDQGSRAVDLNLQGQVIGNSDIAFDIAHGFLWANGVLTDLGTLGGEQTVVADINDRGQIVGYSETASGSGHAFLWENGVMVDIGLGWSQSAHAMVINERGQVAGTYYNNNGSRGFFWDNGVMTDLGLSVYRIEAINERGQVVGRTDLLWPACDAFLWGEGVLTDLNTKDILRWISTRLLLDDSGRVVLFRPGWSYNQPGPYGALIWQNSRFIRLTTLDNTGGAVAQAVNDRGQIVGQSSLASQHHHAVLWEMLPLQ